MVKVLFILCCLIPTIIEASSFSMETIPPPLHLDSPPTVTVVPHLEEYVYVIPEVSGIYFYEGHWYRHYGGSWFRSASYDGPWVYIYLTDVPVVLIELRPYSPSTVVHYRIHYYELSRNWRHWAHSRHWHRHDWYRCGGDRPDRRVRFEVSIRDRNEAHWYRPVPVERYNRSPHNPHQRYYRSGIIPEQRNRGYQQSRTGNESFDFQIQDVRPKMGH